MVGLTLEVYRLWSNKNEQLDILLHCNDKWELFFLRVQIVLSFVCYLTVRSLT